MIRWCHNACSGPRFASRCTLTRLPHSSRRARAFPVGTRLLAAFLLAFAATAHPASESFRIRTLATDLRWPSSLARLADGSFLISEREGRLLHLGPDGERRSIEGTPEVLFAGQGGLLDVALHPAFHDNALLYLSYSTGTPETNTMALFRGRLDSGQLRDGKQLLSIDPGRHTTVHYGGRMLFLPDGTLLLTSGEGFEYREQAQDLDNELGKVLWLTAEGRGVPDNPLQQPGLGRIWSFGHRNPQGITLHERSGDIYLIDHGPRGGDEINHLRPARNYGWPAVTFGVDYSGAYVSPFSSAPGMEDPLWVWDPSIAPSGLAYYDGDAFPRWRDSLLIGGLASRDLRRVQLTERKVVSEEVLLRDLDERIRDVRVFGDDIYLLTDSEQGRLLQIVPINYRPSAARP